MPMPSFPSSGLSLIIHFTIIGVATVMHGIVTYVPMPRVLAPYWERVALSARVVKWAKRTLSLAIIMTLTSLTFFFTIVAIQTGIREGARESHMQYIGAVMYTVLQVVNPQFIPMTENLTRTITYDRFAADFLKTPYTIHDDYLTMRISK